MNESQAAEVLLLRAFETRGSSCSDAEREAASRSALQAVGADAPADAFLAARAGAGLRRLAERDPALLRWRRWRSPLAAAPWLAAAAGFISGVVVDHIGSARFVNLLAPPVWAVLAWNLAVYVGLGLGALRPAARSAGSAGSAGSAATGLVQRALAAAAGRRHREAPAADAGGAAAWRRFAADWAAASLPLNKARAALALHLGAAALALGLVCGMYLRGLVLDYRAGWQSTFLDAAAVHAWLGWLLAPASALSGIALPDAAALQALRWPQAGATAASAAPWIHLYALTLGLWVLLPRLALAGWCGARVQRLRRSFPLPLDDAYFRRLLTVQRGAPLRLQVWPHARGPEARAQAALRRLASAAFGAEATLQLAPAVAYGSEDEPAPLDGGDALRLVLCDLGATPEPEVQGRLLRALGAGGAAPWLLLDESAFVQRFGAASPRVEERRQAWRALAAAHAGGAVFVDLHAPDLGAAEQALQAALP